MTRRVRGPSICALAAGLLLAGAASAQQAPVAATAAQTQWEIIEDPILRDMARLDRIAPFEDLAPLWDFVDPDLQRDVEAALRRLDLDADAAHQRLAVALIDLTDLDQPRVAAVNGDVMMYAARSEERRVGKGCRSRWARSSAEENSDTV